MKYTEIRLADRTMDNSDGKWRNMVFRLRGLPCHINHPNTAASLLSAMLDNMPVDSIRVFSLATSLFMYGDQPSKVATVMFTEVPDIIKRWGDEEQWTIPSSGSFPQLILDTHFMGMTPLNDVSPTEHSYE